MAQLLAIEWDEREIRVAAGGRRGGQVHIEQAFSVSLAPRDASDSIVKVNVGERLASALSARGISSEEALVAVGRASIELRLLTMPPAPAEELADMVRFQATQQFAGLGDDWLLDYLPVEAQDEAKELQVLAAAISPDLVTQIHKTCETAGIRAQRMIMRPCAAASLVRRSPSEFGVRLLVERVSEEADLTILDGANVVFMRTARLPGEIDSQEQSDALLREIRRTIAAVQNQLGGRKVEQIVMFGDAQKLASLTERIISAVSLPVVAHHPFQGLDLSKELRSTPPEYPGGYAPLLGMLVDEVSDERHAIDFLDPRRPPPPPDHRRSLTIAGACAAALVLLLLGGVLWSNYSLDREIADRKAELAGLVKFSTEKQPIRDATLAIDEWLADDINWLDEIYWLSEQMPDGEQARVNSLTMAVKHGTASIAMSGFTTDDQTIDMMESSLRDEQHNVKVRNRTSANEKPNYTEKFEKDITLVGDRL